MSSTYTLEKLDEKYVKMFHDLVCRTCNHSPCKKGEPAVGDCNRMRRDAKDKSFKFHINLNFEVIDRNCYIKVEKWV